MRKRDRQYYFYEYYLYSEPVPANQYTGCPISIDKSKYPLKYAICKEMVLTNIFKDFRGHLKVKTIFKMETPIFDTRFENSRKFYVRNYIFKFVIVTLRRYNPGQIVKKCSEAVYLNFGGIWE